MIIDFGRHELFLSLTDKYIDGLHAVQGETARQIKFTLVDTNGQVQDATGKTLIMTVSLKGGIDQTKAEGNAEGEFLITLTPAMVSRYGNADFQLILTEGSEILASVIGKMRVERNIAYDSGDGSNILLDFAELKQVMDLAKTINDQVNQTLDQTIAEREKSCECSNRSCECADRAETALGKTQTIKQGLSNVLDKETAREEAEKRRQTEETTREQNERAREQNETNRKQNETTRGQQEETRKNQESTRQQNETTREQQETARETAEQARQTQETAREQQETQRETQEGTREKNESARKTAETVRQQNETAREETWTAWENLIEKQALPKGTPMVAGVVKIDKADGVAVSKETLNQNLENKVNKEIGKGLSSNDYTKAEKDKLEGIEDGANKTMINDTLTSVSTTEALSANQGKILDDKKADKSTLDILGQEVAKKADKTELEGFKNITIIANGASTAGIPNDTIILELE